jgi:dienelactone hydrolase
MLPDIWGIGDDITEKAEKLAQLGHIVFIADLYGNGLKIAGNDSALEQAEDLMEDRMIFAERVGQGLNILKEQNKVDQANLGVVGFGLGATGALELVLTGTPVKATVLFYPQPDFETMLNFRDIRSSLLLLYGVDDEYVPREARNRFLDVLSEAHLDWQLIIYCDSRRGFANSAIGFEVSEGMAYNYNADLRSFDAMRQFFTDMLK